MKLEQSILYVLVVSGPNVLDEHCVIENKDGFVVLDPFPEASCSVNGAAIRKRTRLQQGILDISVYNCVSVSGR